MISQKDGLKKVQEYLELSIDGAVSAEFMREACLFIAQTDYENIAEERSITRICGYPLCDNPLTKVYKQANVIRRKQVYDISKRKMYCSDACFKASEHLASQIPEIAIWLRIPEDQPKALNFIPHQVECFYPGTPVLTPIHVPPEDRLATEEQPEVQLSEEEQPEQSLTTDIAKLVMDLESVTIGGRPSAKNLQQRVAPKDAENKLKEMVKTFQVNKLLGPLQEEKTLPETYAGKGEASNAGEVKKSGEASNAGEVKKSVEPALSKPVKKPVSPQVPPQPPINPEVILLQATETRLREWFSLVTLQYVMGRTKFYEMCHARGITTEQLFPASHHNPDKIAGLRKFYRHLCNVLDERDKEDEEEDEKILKKAEKTAASLSDKDSAVSVPAAPAKKKTKPKRPNPVKTTEPDVGETEDEQDYFFDLPYIDDIHQKEIRASLFFDEIQNIITKYLSPVVFQYNQDLIQLIHTFRISSETLYCNPLVWLLVTMCLIKLVSLKHPGEALEKPPLLPMMEKLATKIGTSLTKLHAMLDNVLVALLPHADATL